MRFALALLLTLVTGAHAQDLGPNGEPWTPPPPTASAAGAGPLGTFATTPSPNYLALHPNGNVLVNGGTALRSFQTNGDLVWSTSVNSGRGVTARASGELLASSGAQVNRYTTSGGFINTFVTLLNPNGILELADGRVLISDFSSGSIITFHPIGVVLGTFATGLGPTSILQLPDTRVLIIFNSESVVRAYAPDGTPLGTFATGAGVNRGAVLPDGSVLLSRSGAGIVDHVRADGTSLGIFASGLTHPTGIVALPDDRVLVAEFSANRISAFDTPTAAPITASFGIVSSTASVAPGGTFELSGYVGNMTASPIRVRAKLVVTSPSGARATGMSRAPVVPGRSLILPDVLSRYTVPAGAEPGTYTATVELRSLPSGELLTTKETTFEVTAPPFASVRARAEAGPNPFSDRTVLRYALAEAGDVSLRVYDALGREVAVLADGRRAAGSHAVPLDGTRLPAGVYTWRLATDGAVQTGRLTRIR